MRKVEVLIEGIPRYHRSKEFLRSPVDHDHHQRELDREGHRAHHAD